MTARYALDGGFHVVVEGILYADRYGDMLAQLRADHRGVTHGYYLYVPLGEAGLALDQADRRRCQRGPTEGLLPATRSAPGGIETVIGAHSARHETVDRIMVDTALAHLPATDR